MTDVSDRRTARAVWLHRLHVLRAAMLVLALLGAGAPLSTAAAAGFPAPPGGSFRDAPFAPEMVVLPAGRFVMGSSEAETHRENRAPAAAAYEHPPHLVAIDRPFAVSRSHVSVDEFARFVADTRRTDLGGCMVDEGGKWGVEAARSFRDPAFRQNGRHPVVCVTWADATAYAEWLSRRTRHRYRLLHETEWEYAARGGTTTARWWGEGPERLCAYANGADLSFDRAYPGDPQVNRTCDDGWAGTNPSGAFPSNPFGLNDMLGNAWQWTADCFRETHDGQEVAETECERRAIRGGSWHNYPNVLRAANRFWLPPTMRSSSVGFRVARDAD